MTYGLGLIYKKEEEDMEVSKAMGQYVLGRVDGYTRNAADHQQKTLDGFVDMSLETPDLAMTELCAGSRGRRSLRPL